MIQIWHYISSIGIIGLLFLVTACAPTRYQAHVEAYADQTAKDYESCPRFIVLSGQNKNGELDLEFKEYNAQVRQMLETHGYVYDLKNPCQVIFLSYSISTPSRAHRTISIPEHSYINKRWVATGSSAHTIIETYYTRTIVVDAMNVTSMGKSKKMLPLWRVNVTSTGETGSMRECFPFLLKAMEEYMGSSGNHDVHIFLKDMQVREVKSLPAKLGK